jgi:hypothetical protein
MPATPVAPESRKPFAKRTDEELEAAFVYKTWQILTVTGGMASLVRSDNKAALKRIREEFVARGRTEDQIDALWTTWQANNPGWDAEIQQAK